MSYALYRQILSLIKSYGTQIVLGRDIQKKNEFIIIRHDVEFSPERAYRLSLVETEEGVCSNYFFQIANNTYNIFSKRNMKYITEMQGNGHEIGLHIQLNGLIEESCMAEVIQRELEVMGIMLGTKIRAFSIHRPTPDILKKNIKLDHVINAYQDDYFTFAENEADLNTVKVKYISDARHQWNYGKPDEKMFNQYKKVQVLTHPYSWTENGYDNLHNFESMIEEKNNELMESIDQECKHFNEVKEVLQKSLIRQST
ncbi:MAG: hypothetical protein HDR17_13280 [Lachnospiraceae bacterium]|nr:hypothetical protein [Lachnospiraceae bacterium]